MFTQVRDLVSIELDFIIAQYGECVVTNDLSNLYRSWMPILWAFGFGDMVTVNNVDAFQCLAGKHTVPR